MGIHRSCAIGGAIEHRIMHDDRNHLAAELDIQLDIISRGHPRLHDPKSILGLHCSDTTRWPMINMGLLQQICGMLLQNGLS